MAERGVQADHVTLNRWVAKCSPLIAANARRRKAPTDRSRRMDEIYIRVKGEWIYLYRAVDKFGKTLGFMLARRRNKPAATRFFARALEVDGLPRKIVIDRSGASTAGITAINRMSRRFGCLIPIEMVRIKYLNNMVEQDHRTIKKRVRPTLGFKSFPSASVTLEGVEVANMIRKGQVTPGLCPLAQFAALAAWQKGIKALFRSTLKFATKPIQGPPEPGISPVRPPSAPQAGDAVDFENKNPQPLGYAGFLGRYGAQERTRTSTPCGTRT